VCQNEHRDERFEYPFEQIERVEIRHIVLFDNHCDEFVTQHEREDYPRYRYDYRFGKCADH
jgi:hypothetical protein